MSPNVAGKSFMSMCYSRVFSPDRICAELEYYETLNGGAWS